MGRIVGSFAGRHCTLPTHEPSPRGVHMLQLAVTPQRVGLGASPWVTKLRVMTCTRSASGSRLALPTRRDGDACP